MASDGIITGCEINTSLHIGEVAEWTMATVLKTAPSKRIEKMLVLPPRTANGVDWAFAPDWLSVEEACFLGGHARGFMLQIVEAGGVDLDNAGRIEKRSLWEWQETSAELAHWDD